MDTMTQQNAALVEETAAASEEMTNQAQDLLAMVQQFKISDNLAKAADNYKHKEIHIHSLKTKETVRQSEITKIKSEKKYSPEDDGYEKF